MITSMFNSHLMVHFTSHLRLALEAKDPGAKDVLIALKNSFFVFFLSKKKNHLKFDKTLKK